MRRRVVVTGLGAVTPLGNSRDDYWQALVAGKSGVGPVTRFDPKDLSTKIVAEVKGFEGEALIGKRDARRMDRYAQ
ncbi:MAG: beta-ketoacyl-[acyl-carrier-protein] synthase II, partial [Candidatus Eremiobacteraeota bacterium]|nr:beta-ketoacyl-[acyl-carrier-protein] synthase II [Candidatus Eremiobacteraeota bacterium]